MPEIWVHSYPRQVFTHSELTKLIEQGKGFIFNNRRDRKMLHHVKCEALEAMVTSAYEKFFFESLDQAKSWADWQHGADGWEVCGRCHY